MSITYFSGMDFFSFVNPTRLINADIIYKEREIIDFYYEQAPRIAE